jgi:hypothetical protein
MKEFGSHIFAFVVRKRALIWRDRRPKLGENKNKRRDLCACVLLVLVYFKISIQIN